MKSFFTRIFILVVGFSLYMHTPSAFAETACQGTIGKLPGQCAPNFTIKDLNGKTFELDKLRGKVVIVNFWATWCKPCIVEMPSMENAYKKLDKTNLVMMAISIDTNTKEIHGFLDNKIQDHLTFPIFFDENLKISSLFGTVQVPETFIIDKSGRIVDKVIGMREWDDSITINYLKLLAK